MGWTAEFVAELIDLVGDLWTDVGVIARTTEMSKIPWEVLVTQGIRGQGPLIPPFAVVAVGRYQEWPEYQTLEGGSYRVPVAIYYVDRTDGDPGTEERIELKMEALAAVLRANTQEQMRCPNDPTIDVTDGNPANQAFTQQGNHPFMAGELTVDLLSGTQPT